MKYIKLLILVFVSVIMLKCEYQVTEFGFDAAIQGMVKDNNGTPLHGDMSSNNLVVKLLGDGDQQPIEIRVNGDGTYQNVKMFPKKHDVWLEGPIVNSEHVSVDFAANPSQNLDFTVTPLISPKLNSATGSGTSISISYVVSPNDGNTISKMEVYCSTVKYPTAAIGSRANVYFTKTVTLSEPSGSVEIDELESGVKYFVRIGAQAKGAATMNYSNQIEVAL